MKIIGVKGRLHSGKDTLFEYLCDMAPELVIHREGFADKMKMSGVRALGYDPTSVKDALKIANYIKEHCRVQVVTSDGKPLQIFDLTPQRYTYNANTKYGEAKTHNLDISGREYWQRYGTEAHRDVYGDAFHVDALLPTDVDIRTLYPNVDILVITDVRFANEAERILSFGTGEVWQIDAEERLGPLPEDAHISEQPLPENLVTCRIPNNGTLKQFETNVAIAWSLSNRSVYR